MDILIVEDEPSLQAALVDLLQAAGHAVDAVGDGAAALERASAHSYDVVLLDVMLPGIDGNEVCARLSRNRPDLGILMLTAKGAEEDKVRGLQLGADDYVTKPFGAKELLARVEAVGRRAVVARVEAEVVEIDGCSLDLGMCRGQRDGVEIQLTAREAQILRLLHRSRSRAVSRADLLEQVWDAPGDLQTRTVDMTIANLRQKIERNPSEPCIVVTVKGVGYAWGTP